MEQKNKRRAKRANSFRSESLTRTRKIISIREMCLIAVFVAVTAVLTQISIPLPLGVPLSLQTFAVFLTASMLGPKNGTIALIVYVALGAVGAPVFVGFGGGFHRIVGPWGGYLLSYPIVALIVGFAASKGKRIWLAAGLLLGAFVNLSLGTVQFGFVSGVSSREAFLAAFVPFILPELIKTTIVFLIAPKMKKLLGRFEKRA